MRSESRTVETSGTANARRRVSRSLVALAALLALVGSGKRATVTSPATPRLECSLRAVPPLSVSRPVQLEFRVRNRSRKPVYVLGWYTPLEGIRGKILRVTRDGTELRYLGPMMKRGAPVRGDYVRIAAGDSAIARVEISKVYDLASSGSYRVELDTAFHDFVWNEAQIAKPGRAPQRLPLECDPITFVLGR